MSATPEALILTGVGKTYGPRTILEDISLSFAFGSVTLLVGANGAGKSTLLKMAAGLSRPSSGSMETSVDEARLGYLGHATFVYPALTAIENLAFWRRLYNLSADSADLLPFLQRVDLKKYAHERAGVFSRGMAQRLNLARVLSLSPELLLLDEPGTGLDAAGAAMLRTEIAEARTRGACVIWISHDPAQDGGMADRLISLKAKKVEYDGPVSPWLNREENGGEQC